eukprot:1110078-Prymnesium_polylepis.2
MTDVVGSHRVLSVKGVFVDDAEDGLIEAVAHVLELAVEAPVSDEVLVCGGVDDGSDVRSLSNFLSKEPVPLVRAVGVDSAPSDNIGEEQDWRGLGCIEGPVDTAKERAEEPEPSFSALQEDHARGRGAHRSRFLFSELQTISHRPVGLKIGLAMSSPCSGG